MEEPNQILLFLTDKNEIKDQITVSFSKDGYEVAFSGTDLETMEGTLTAIIVYYESFDNGMKALAKIRERQATTWLPTIFLGHDKMLDPLIRALEAGADVYVKRPVKLPELKAIIEATQRLVKETVTKTLRLKEADVSHEPQVTADGYYEPALNELKVIFRPPGAASIYPVRIVEDIEKIAELNFSTEESYVYAKIDGDQDLRNLASNSELGTQETLSVILSLYQRKVVRLRPRT